MIPSEQNIPTDAASVKILYCPVCGGAIALESLPIAEVIEDAKLPKLMPGTEENVTLSPEHTTLENYYV